MLIIKKKSRQVYVMLWIPVWFYKSIIIYYQDVHNKETNVSVRFWDVLSTVEQSKAEN